MVPSLRMQHAVHEKVRQVGAESLILLGRLAVNHRYADHDVGLHGIVRVVKGEDVRRIVALAVLRVEHPPLLFVDEAHGEAALRIQRSITERDGSSS